MKRRSNCPLNCAIEIIGDKWTLLILRDIFISNAKTFKDFMKIKEGISTNILSNRLALLVENNFLIKERDPDNGLVFNYSLTDKGRSVGPILRTIALWGQEHIPGTDIQFEC